MMKPKTAAQQKLFAVAEKKPSVLDDEKTPVLGAKMDTGQKDFAPTRGMPQDSPDNGSDQQGSVQPKGEYRSTAPRPNGPRSLKPKSFVRTASVQPKMIRVK